MLREMLNPHAVLPGSNEIELNGMAISLNHPSPVMRLLQSQIASQLPPVNELLMIRPSQRQPFGLVANA